MRLFHTSHLRKSAILVSDAFEHLFDKYRYYLLTIVVALAAFSVLAGLYALLGYLAVAYVERTNASFASAVSIKLLFFGSSYILILILFSYINGLFVAATRWHSSFRANCVKIWHLLPRLVGLSVVLALISFLISAPLYGIAVNVFARLPYRNLTSFVLFALFIVFICLAAIWFSTSAFVLIDRNVPILQALKDNIAMVRGKELQFFGRLLVLGLLIMLFQFVAIMLSITPSLQILGTLLVLFIATPFSYSYLNELYSDLR